MLHSKLSQGKLVPDNINDISKNGKSTDGNQAENNSEKKSTLGKRKGYNNRSQG